MFNTEQAIGATEEALMLNFIQGTCIIDFGFILKVRGIDIVDVQLASATKESAIQVFTCMLASMGGQNAIDKTDPKEGDKVIVFYPRTFQASMFKPDLEETVIDQNAHGYAFGKGIAFLANQFFTKPYKQNFRHITDDTYQVGITDKTVTLDIGIDADSDGIKSKATATIGTDGEFTYELKDGDDTKASLNVKPTGEFTYEITDKAVFHLKDDGNIEVDAKGGKFKLTNDKGKTLGQIIKNLASHSKSATTVGSPAAHTMNPATQANFQQDETDAGNLLE